MKAPKIELLAVDDLIPYINNARTHSEEQVLQIASSIREFGFNNPVLIDKEQTIIAGHGRVQAARKLGIEKVPCVRVEHLDEVQKKAYILADNKIALNAGWDTDLLNLELEAIKNSGMDVSITGFTDLDLARLSDDLDQKALDDMADAGGSDVVDSSASDEPKTEMAPLSVVLEHDQRVLVFEALRLAKNKHGLDTSGEAIWAICKEWMENEQSV